MSRARFARALVALALFPTVALANQQFASVESLDSIAPATTSWNKNAELDKFDSNLGTLVSVDIFLTGKVEGSARFESLDPSPTTVTVNLSSTVTLKRPDNSTLVAAFPLFSVMENVAPHDGMIDFGGPSGRTFNNLTDMDMTQATLSAPFSAADLAAFSAPGGGQLLLPVMAIGTSNGSGSGNLLVAFSTMAGADVRIVYTYKVPEPATIALLAPAALAILRRRRA